MSLRLDISMHLLQLLRPKQAFCGQYFLSYINFMKHDVILIFDLNVGGLKVIYFKFYCSLQCLHAKWPLFPLDPIYRKKFDPLYYDRDVYFRIPNPMKPDPILNRFRF